MPLLEARQNFIPLTPPSGSPLEMFDIAGHLGPDLGFAESAGLTALQAQNK